MHVSSSQSNTATQTDDKTHTERTAAAVRILVVHAGLQCDMLLAQQRNRVTHWGYRSVRPMITPLDNKCGPQIIKNFHFLVKSRRFRKNFRGILCV